jgi:imidazolonepropionase-like amidohydrolase
VDFRNRFGMTNRITTGGCVRNRQFEKSGGWLRCVLLLLCVFLPFSCSKKHAPGPLAITHVTLIDATGAEPKSDVTVIVADKKIQSISPSTAAKLPRDTQIIDATGKFLIPGLTDFHLHLTGAGEPSGSREFFIPLLLANGITTVRDMGGYLQSLVPLRQEIRSGKRRGPEIFFAGPYLDGDPPSFQPSLVVTNATQATDDVQSLVAQGVDFIKVQSILSRTAYFAIADAAKQQHITFVGHVPDRVTAAEASDAGQKSIEHLTGVLRACSSVEPRLMEEQFRGAPKNETPQGSHAREVAWERELLSTYSEKTCDALIAKFRANQTWQTPTLVLLRHDAYPTPQSDAAVAQILRYTPKLIVPKWQEVRRKQDQFATPTEFELRNQLFARSSQVVAKMQAAGVGILAGTDSAAPELVPGFSLHEELVLLMQAGLSPMQALQAATRNPAEFMGVIQKQGTVEVGKNADLLLLDANPLEDISNTTKISALVIGGELVDRRVLDYYLERAARFATTERPPPGLYPFK